MSDNNARVIATLGVWFATATVFIVGVFKIDWPTLGNSTGSYLMLAALGICAAAGVSTVAIWYKHPR
jgi:hypothetical protein